MPDPFKDWLARAESEKRLAAVQASYGLDSTGGASDRLAQSSSTQLKFLSIINDLDPSLVKPKPNQASATSPAPRNDKRLPDRGGPSLLTAALKEHKDSKGAQSIKCSDSAAPSGTTSR